MTEDEVVAVVAGDGPIGRDDHDIEIVDLVEFARLGFGRTRHAGQLVVHAEVVLERDRGVGLRLTFDLQPFLGLERGMEAVAVAATVHDSTGEFVDDHDLTVLDHILVVFREKRVGLQ